jgi:hypothetical protein
MPVKRIPGVPAEKVIVDPVSYVPEEVDPNLKVGRGKLNVASYAGSFVLGWLVESAIGSIIGEMEREISDIEQARIKRLWSEGVYTKILPTLNWIIERQPYVTNSGYINDNGVGFQLGKRQYIRLTWELLYRLQTEEKVSAVGVYLVKTFVGDPGFVELLEGISYISHELTPYRHSLKPRRYFDAKDEWLRHIEYVKYILAWDIQVHRLANRYRDSVDEALAQLEVITETIRMQSVELPSYAQQKINDNVIGGSVRRVRDALAKMDFRKARVKLKLLITSVRGHFVNYKVYEYRIDKITNEIGELRGIIGRRPHLQKGRLSEEEQALLSLFLDQAIENL